MPHEVGQSVPRLVLMPVFSKERQVAQHDRESQKSPGDSAALAVKSSKVSGKSLPWACTHSRNRILRSGRYEASIREEKCLRSKEGEAVNG